MSEGISRVFKNSLSLLVLQGGNYIVPFILTPYLIIVLGIESFGLISFAISVNIIFRAVVSYGFDFTGTKSIAENYNNTENVSKLLSDILLSKLILACFCFICLILLTSFVPVFSEEKGLFYLYFIIVLSDVFFPVWLYQGMQEMKVLTISKLTGKFIYVSLTLAMVKESTDLLLIPLLEGVISIVVGLISLAYGMHKFELKFKLSTFTDLLFTIKAGWHVFFSRITSLMYTKFNIVLLGLLTNNTIVGFYSVAENIYMAIRMMVNPINQALFPYLSTLRKASYSKYAKKVRVFFIAYLMVLFLMFLSLYNFGNYILSFLLDYNSNETIDILNVFSFCLLFSVGSFLSSVLIIEEKGRILSKVTLITLIANSLIVYPSILHSGALGLAYCVLAVQVLHFILQMYVNKKTLLNVE